MRICKVLGQVTLSQTHESVTAGRFLIARPLSGEALRGELLERDEVVVVYDELGATNDLRIAVSEGTEAAMPFRPRHVPVDAYNAAILDSVHVVQP